MELGYSFVEDSFQGTVQGACYLDASEWGEQRGAISGGRAGRQIVRPMASGRPDIKDFANKCRPWACRRTPWGLAIPVQALNEPNLPHEKFNGGPDEYADWFWKLTDECPECDFYYAPMSPSGNWLVWYTFGLPNRVIRQRASGLAVHAYGNLDQIRYTIDQIRSLDFSLPIAITEFNFGAGQAIDKEWWARDQLPRIIEYFQSVPEIELAAYFSYRWPRPDGGLEGGTPVDAVGTAIEEIIGQWT